MAARDFSFKSVEILFDHCLGSGAYGSVYRAKCDHLPCAAKVLHPMFFNTADPAVRDTVDRFRVECKLLSSLQHPNIVQFLGEFTNASGHAALVMELMDESLTSFLERHDPNDNPVPTHLLIDFSHDVSLGLHYLHNNGIIHRDLTSNNVLLMRECRAKITDLGVSKLHDATQQMTQCPGAPIYMPPEALSNFGDYTEKLDCFSFGVLLIQMATCCFPQPQPHEVFIADTNSPTGYVRMPVKEANRRAKELAKIDDNHVLRPLILHCIEDKASKRPSSSELCQHLEMLKKIPEYVQSKEDRRGGPVASVSALLPAALIGEKISEIEALRRDIETYQEKLRGHEELIQMKEKELESARATQLEVKEYEDKLRQHKYLLREREEELQKERARCTEIETELKKEKEKMLTEEVEKLGLDTRTMSFVGEIDVNRKVISGLDPNFIALLSKDKRGELNGVMYGIPGPNAVTVISTHTESLSSRIGMVLNAYRALVNASNLSLDFIPVPSSFPQEELEQTIESYNKTYPSCHLSILEDLSIIQVISLQPAALLKVKEAWAREWIHTIFMSGQRKLCLKKADIVKESTTVIVCAANRRLNHNAGVSKAINAASGGKMQQYCDEYTKKHGFLEECGLMRTQAAGDLKCRWVLHAVGPDGTKYTPAELQDKMRGLITSCLVEADKLGAHSIAIPPIGTGHFHVDKKLAAHAIMAAAMDYDYLNDNTLREIVICVIDEKTYAEFADVFADRRAEMEYMQETVPEFFKELMDSSVTPFAPNPASSCKTQ